MKRGISRGFKKKKGVGVEEEKARVCVGGWEGGGEVGGTTSRCRQTPVVIQGSPLLLHPGNQNIGGRKERDRTPFGGTPSEGLGELRFQLVRGDFHSCGHGATALGTVGSPGRDRMQLKEKLIPRS
jgi:hypothetical protein